MLEAPGFLSGMKSLQVGDVGLRGPGEQWPSSGLLLDRPSLMGKVAAIFGGSMGRQCRTVVVVLDKGRAWIRSRPCRCLR